MASLPTSPTTPPSTTPHYQRHRPSPLNLGIVPTAFDKSAPPSAHIIDDDPSLAEQKPGLGGGWIPRRLGAFCANNTKCVLRTRRLGRVAVRVGADDPSQQGMLPTQDFVGTQTQEESPPRRRRRVDPGPSRWVGALHAAFDEAAEREEALAERLVRRRALRAATAASLSLTANTAACILLRAQERLIAQGEQSYGPVRRGRGGWLLLAAPLEWALGFIEEDGPGEVVTWCLLHASCSGTDCNHCVEGIGGHANAILQSFVLTGRKVRHGYVGTVAHC